MFQFSHLRCLEDLGDRKTTDSESQLLSLLSEMNSLLQSSTTADNVGFFVN